MHDGRRVRIVFFIQRFQPVVLVSEQYYLAILRSQQNDVAAIKYVTDDTRQHVRQ